MRTGLLTHLRGLARRRWTVGVITAIGVAAAAAAASHSQPSVGVLKVRLGGDSHQTRIVIELDQATRGTLVSPPTLGDHVALALAHVDVAGDMQGDGAGLVKSWRVEEAAGAAQVHLDLARPGMVRRRFLLPPGDGLTTYRYVIDVADSPAQAPATQVAATPTQELRATHDGPRAQRLVQLARIEAPPAVLTPSRRVVVIDAGHGGHDPGAAGASVHEKTLTLAAALALRDRLEASGRYHVVLTRDHDVYVPLEERVRIARKANADLFISLHADSGSEPGLKGATVYTLSEPGATRAAKQVFEKADWMDMSLPGQDAQVNRILLDLTQRETRNRSSEFAETLLARVADVTPAAAPQPPRRRLHGAAGAGRARRADGDGLHHQRRRRTPPGRPHRTPPPDGRRRPRHRHLLRRGDEGGESVGMRPERK